MRSLRPFRGGISSGFWVQYLFLDAIYERLRMAYGVNEAILCAWGITRQGEKVLLHLALGTREGYEDWLEFLRDMVVRGLGVPITADASCAETQPLWPFLTQAPHPLI